MLPSSNNNRPVCQSWSYLLISVSSLDDRELIQKALAPHKIDPKRLLLIQEEWGENGAGNGFGTLYLIQQAIQIIKSRDGIELLDEMAHGASVGIIHAAGMGKRLYPLPLCCKRCKSLIPLPSCAPTGISINGQEPLISAIYRSSLPLVSKNSGRFQVLWGDQLVLSTPPSTFDAPLVLFVEPVHKVRVEDWEKEGWHHYGVIGEETGPRIFEKLSAKQYAALPLLHQGFYKNVGAFSFSVELFLDLVKEFSIELKTRTGHADSDHDFWMPLTLLGTQYSHLIQSTYAKRMGGILERYSKPMSVAPCNDFFYDFGRVRCYFETLQELLNRSKRGSHLREFLFLTAAYEEEKQRGNSIILASTLSPKVKVKNSIVIHSEINSGFVENTILINSQFHEIVADQNLILSLDQTEGPFYPEPQKTYVGFDKEQKKQIVQDRIDNNPKRDWKACLKGNLRSYESFSRVY